jgi:hypothetical protein
MKSNLYKYLGFVFAAFSLISAVFSIVAIEKRWILYAVLACTGVAMIVSALFFFRAREFDNALKDLNKALEKTDLGPSIFELRNLKNEAELKEIWKISQSIYRENNVEFNKVLSWWKCYQKGVYVLYQEFTIVGYLSLWPLKKQAFKDILAGNRRERAITARSICEESYKKPITHWYISNIVISNKYRKTGALKILILEVLRRWINEAKFDSDIKLCALAYSKEGEALLRRFGFSKFREAEETLDKLPVYLSTPTLSELQQMVKRVAGK